MPRVDVQSMGVSCTKDGKLHEVGRVVGRRVGKAPSHPSSALQNSTEVTVYL